MTSTDEWQPYAGFEGRVDRTFSESEPSFARRPSPPPGAPNVIVVLTDDLGFSDIGCYGSEIETPTLDGLARRGIRYRNFHAAPMCSPTRAALLTGLNPHAAGMGYLATEDAGFPGYRGRLNEQAATAAEVFRHNGYSTFAIGKWHLSSEEDPSAAAEKESWPVQRGFDRWYGFLEGLTNYHHPARLLADNHLLDVDGYPDGYYLTDDLTDQAIAMVQSAKLANPDKPFFMYFAHGAVHAPLMAKPEDMNRYRDRYAAGWDELRRARFDRQIELGIVPPDTALPERNREELFDVAPWDTLDATHQQLFARYMEVYAAMVDNVDQNLGRLLACVDELGELDNTIVVFTSDNGASREGGIVGSTEYYRTVRRANDGLPDEDSLAVDHSRIELIGGPRLMAHYPRGWAMASNTPFRMYKATTFAGGHQVPFVISYPAGVRDHGAIRDQYAHVSQILPTLVDLIGLEPVRARNGRAVRPFTGASLAPTMREAQAPTPNTRQYYEVRGHRGIHEDGWDAVTLHYNRADFEREHWHLFDLAGDASQSSDVSAKYPDKVDELQAAFDEEAWRNEVYPLDDGTGMHRVPRYWNRPPQPVRIPPFAPTVESWRAKALTVQRSFRIDVELVYQPGDSGVLVSHGDQGGGYVLYAEEERAVFVYNYHGALSRIESPPLPAGTRTITLDLTAPGEGVWDVQLLVDGDPEPDASIRLPMLSGLSPFQGITVGLDRRSPVVWELFERHGHYRYSGRLVAVTYTPGELAPDAAARHLIERRLTMLRTQ